jgi:prepilin-type N-terminal cleavage/methylation domain-containing protein
MTTVTPPRRRSHLYRLGSAKPAAFTLMEIMIVVLIIGILLAIAVPNFIRAREQSRRKTCIGNLRKIEYAKDAYLMDRNLEQTTVITENNLWPATGTGYLKVAPQCPSNGIYTIGDGRTDPTCSFGNGHIITGN